ncbi:MAG: DUF433 domain-containing protein [Oscillatoriales cyanobacterium]|nr:MAG: DUF433 domain-containing protein [Oscillatoriales cyanobacterium]
MPTLTDIGTLIVSTPETCGNRPRIAGTRITVQRIAVWYKMGMSPEEIIAEISHLNLAQVHGALAYYYANQEQINVDIAAEEAEYDRLANGCKGETPYNYFTIFLVTQRKTRRNRVSRPPCVSRELTR